MSELQWKPEQVVQLDVLGGQPAAATARILELSGKRLRLATELKVIPGAAVRLQWDNQVLLGEVLSSESDGFWIEISHLLLDTAALMWQPQDWQT